MSCVHSDLTAGKVNNHMYVKYRHLLFVFLLDIPQQRRHRRRSEVNRVREIVVASLESRVQVHVAMGNLPVDVLPNSYINKDEETGST